ncbi:MAG TPA: hypothetical protein VFS62_13190 [Chloroflexota bacterium]|nr:hypothetical protein [Chloroflexota bacterium]
MRPADGRAWRESAGLRRTLEVLPGLCTLVVLTSLVWASIAIPLWLAIAAVLYDAYWLYRSTALGIRVVVAYRRMRRSEATDWLADARLLPNFDRVHHLLIIPTYGESVDILRTTLRHVAEQDFPRERVAVVLAFEARDDAAPRRARLLTQEFEGQFGWLWATFHPSLPGEVAGKSSNEAWAARRAKEWLIDEAGVDIEYTTITTCDADSRLAPKYFSALTCHFLSGRAERIFQPVILFFSNIWRVPAPSRVINSVHSLWQLARLTRTDKLVPQSTYSMALRSCVAVDYWDVDVIPEDSHMFFKMLFRLPHVTVEPIYLPVMSDAAEGTGYISTLRGQFNQEKRWAWGVADVPYVISGLLHGGSRQWYRGLRYIEEHLSWPLSPFVITFGGAAPGFFNHAFARTQMGHLLPNLCSYLLTASLASMGAMVIVDHKLKPPAPLAADQPLVGLRYLAEWVLMPAVGIGLSALPGLVAHLRLLTGRYLEYNVTEKHAAPAPLEPLPVLQLEQVAVPISTGQ